MSLADELLADLEDGGEGEEEMNEIEEVGEGAGHDMDNLMNTDDPSNADRTSYTNSIRSLAKLRDSKQMKGILERMEAYAGEHAKGQRSEMCGPVEADPEYLLIVEANNITVEIDNEINITHKYVRDLYYKRFPELESLVQQPIEYVKTVKELGNNIDRSKNNEVLHQILTPATIMVVSVTASTTQGQKLNKDELDLVMEACDMAIDLTECKQRIFDYVESRMSFFAPNLSIITGASVAARIMGAAGGLTNLSKMPSCNVLLLGAQKRTLSGFSMKVIVPHIGFVYGSEIVQKTPPDLRKKAAKLVSSKCSLASRVDSFHQSTDGSVGDSLRADIEQKLYKLQEPPPVKQVKALPTPIEGGKKKRGGRRYRKMKERLGMSELRKASNRMTFGEIEQDAYQEDLGMSVGQMGKKSTGKVRGPLIDSKTKARISKTLQQKIQKQQQVWGGSTTVKKHVAGTASSVAFTPLQGLEIVNPQAAEKKVATTQRYFSTTGGFKQISSTPMSGSESASKR